MDPDALAAALAGSLLDDFVVQRKIGGKDVTPGGMAATVTMHGVCSYVYSVRSRRPAAGEAGELALKVMINVLGDQTGDLRDQFAGEYELLRDVARLPRHPNIVCVLHVFDDMATSERLPGYDFDPQDVAARTTFVVMPLCDRGDLKTEMKRLSRAGEYFPEPRLRQLIGQLLEAILHLKAHRIVHRDIKPDNIMLQSAAGGGERLVLIDFGQCLDCGLYELDGFHMPLPVNMSRGGAPGFLAPEVVTARPGPRTRIDFGKNDDWACGMLLYSLLAGPVDAGANPFSSGDDPRHFTDAGYRPLDLQAGHYSGVLGQVARGLLRVNPAERMDAAAALVQIQDPLAELQHELEREREQRAALELRNAQLQDENQRLRATAREERLEAERREEELTRRVASLAQELEAARRAGGIAEDTPPARPSNQVSTIGVVGPRGLDPTVELAHEYAMQYKTDVSDLVIRLAREALQREALHGSQRLQLQWMYEELVREVTRQSSHADLIAARREKQASLGRRADRQSEPSGSLTTARPYALETVIFSGDARKYDTSMVEKGLSSVAQLAPGADWRPLLTKEAVEEHLTELVQQNIFYTGAERRGEKPRGIRFWNLTDQPLTCQPMILDTKETLGPPLTPGRFAPSAGQIRANTCGWSRGQLSDPHTSYMLSIEGVEPVVYSVMPESCQQVVVRVVERAAPAPPAPAPSPSPHEGTPPLQALQAPAPAGGGHHRPRDELAVAKQEFVTWAHDSREMPTHEASQLVEQAIREGQPPPFERAKDVVRERWAAKREMQEQQRAQRAQAPPHAMAGGGGASGGGAAPRMELTIVGRVGRVRASDGPDGFFTLQYGGVTYGSVKIPHIANADENIEVVLSLGDHVHPHRVVRMGLGPRGSQHEVAGPHVVYSAR